eukprot:987204-Ditylum_brightwellii.AAC.2
MMEDKFGDGIIRDILELPGVVGNVMFTPFTKTKGICQVETTNSQVVEAMKHVAEVLSKICNQIPENQKNFYSAFPYPTS